MSNKIKNIFIAILCGLLIYTGYNIYSEHTSGKPAFFFGLKPVLVQSDTLSPEIKKGDIVLIQNKDMQNIQKNEYIYFFANERTKTIERVVRTSDEGFRTQKNDSNKESIIVVNKDKYIGTGIMVFHTAILFEKPIIALIILIILILLYIVISGYVKMFKSKKEANLIEENKSMDL